MMLVSRNIIAALGAAATLLLPSIAMAAQQDGEPTAKVSFADLNLNTAQGVAVLHRRIAATAHAMCDQNGTRDLATQSQSAACRKAALASGNMQIATLVANAQRFAARSDVEIAGR